MIGSARDRADGEVLVADVCIVGAGAAGIALALELIDSKLDVLILESGSQRFDARNQALYKGAVADERLHSPPVRYRQRQFGGSTTIWGGRCTPFDAIDFERREFVPDSGWPITLDDLMPYYTAANRLCEAGEFAYTADAAFAKPPRPMIAGFHSEHFTDNQLERFSCPTNFGARYRQRLEAAPNVQVLLDANVTAIRLNEAGDRVAHLDVQTLSGIKLQARAQQFVLATGGLEVPRLLLASRDRQPQGVGNTHDVVGRYYMCHLAGTLGTLRFNGPRSAIHHGYDVSAEGVYCRRRLALLPATQRSLKLGNFVARLHHPSIPDPAHKDAVLSLLFLAQSLIPYEYATRLYGNRSVSRAQWLRHFGNVAAHPFDALAFAWHMLRDRKFAARKFPSIIIRPRGNLYSLDFHAEQQPNPGSRIRLGDELDALLMPQLLVDWRYTPGDLDTVRRAVALLAGDLERSGVGRFDYDPGTVEQEMTRYGAYGGHHIGTARMGSNPRSSVVDADCRVHGVRNLFIAGSAVFPTSSQANPTLTVVALALRLGARLKAEARGLPTAASVAQAFHTMPPASSSAVRRVLVLGGDEYIGSRVLAALAESGWAEPIADAASSTGVTQRGVQVLRFDPTDPAALLRAMKDADAVVNCLSGRPQVIESAARALYATAPSCTQAPLVVHISSMSVYGFASGEVGEDTPMRQELGPYATAKIAAEKFAAPYGRKIVLRPGCEYGAGGELWSGRIARWLLSRRIGDLGADGDGYCNLVHIDDLVSAVLLSLQNPVAFGQTLNLALPDPPTWNEYFVRYARALGAVPVRRVSRLFLSLEAKVLAPPMKAVEMAARRVGIARVVPPAIPASLLPLMTQRIRLDSARARSVLGWSNRSLEEGIADAAAWFARRHSGETTAADRSHAHEDQS